MLKVASFNSLVHITTALLLHRKWHASKAVRSVRVDYRALLHTAMSSTQVQHVKKVHAADDAGALLNFEAAAKVEAFRGDLDNARRLFREGKTRCRPSSRYLREWGAFEKRAGSLDVSLRPIPSPCCVSVSMHSCVRDAPPAIRPPPDYLDSEHAHLTVITSATRQQPDHSVVIHSILVEILPYKGGVWSPSP